MNSAVLSVFSTFPAGTGGPLPGPAGVPPHRPARLPAGGRELRGGREPTRAGETINRAHFRLDEIERMAREGVVDPAVFAPAFQDFDNATRSGSRLALSGDDPAGSAADLSAWATQQTARLSALRTTLPAASQSDADDALRLLDRVHRRAVALSSRSGCAQVTSGSTDDLGPVPAEGPCTTGRSTSGAGSAPTDRARTAAPTGQQADPATRQGEQPQQDGGSDPGLVPGVQVGPGGGQDRAGTTPTTSAAPSDDQKNVNVPLPLPVPITVPPLLPGKPGGLLG